MAAEVFRAHVGIYKMEMTDGKIQYIRDADMVESWSYFSDVHVIPPKSEKKRVILLGESAARGFLLEPDYTPAMVIEELLRNHSDLVETEVVDLAESDLKLTGLKSRFLECLTLQPDVIVILAGNNWRGELLAAANSDPRYSHIAGRITDDIEKHKHLKIFVEDVFREKVTEFVKEVGAISRIKGVPVIFCIPEFNLLDCQSSPGERYLTKLQNGKTNDWLLAKTAAEAGLAKDDFQVTESYAGKMIEIDPTHPLGYELLANSKVKQNKYDDARQYFEMGRDTTLFYRTNGKPKIFAVIREAILSEADRSGIVVVDIRALFRQYLDGGIPGRNLFLDYCHFTVEGIQVIAEAVASRILKLLAGESASLGASGKTIAAKPDSIAMGHLLAAIHNAHWGQPTEILEYHCLRALQASDVARKMMIHYIDMTCRLASNTICDSFMQLLATKNLDKYVRALITPRGLQSLEIGLIDAMADALRTTGVNTASYIKHLRLIEHGVNNRTINLLNSHYHVTSYDEVQRPKRAYFQARQRESKFILIAGKCSRVLLKLTLRAPFAGHSSNEIIISCNGTILTKVAASRSWASHLILISEKLILDCVNKIDILWPIPEDSGSEVRCAAPTKSCNSLTNSELTYFVFGEIHSFIADLANS